MHTQSKFTVLIERRNALRWLATVTTSAALLFSALHAPMAHAGNAFGRAVKVAKDLQAALDAPITPTVKWAKDINGVRNLQVLITGVGTDPQLTALRTAIKSAGGSIHVRFPGLMMVTATVPAGLVAALSARTDVANVSPNRTTQRTASTLEAITGALAANVRTNSTKLSYSGLDGSGIGVVVLDSGVMRSHELFYNASAVTRVARNVQMLGTTQANWTVGTDGTTSLEPGTTALNTYDNKVANDTAVTHDAYGHGTHVASILAGRASTLSSAVDTTGIAPDANKIGRASCRERV